MTRPVAADPVAEVDALVAAAAPGVAGPAPRRRAVVLVTGPRLAGVSAVASALRDRLPDRTVVDGPAGGDAPVAVVFVVSAAAALTGSDCALLDTAAARTDVVIGAVSKIDRHRHWPQMLQLATDTLAGYAPRYRDVPWVAVAAAPELGEPRVDDLVTEVAKQLLDPALKRRNRLREWESQLQATARRYQHDAAAASRRTRMAALQKQRQTVLRQQRLAKSERTVTLRSRLARARVQLVHLARKHCGSVGAELHEHAAAVPRCRLAAFETYAGSRVDEVIIEVDQAVAAHLTEAAHELGVMLDPPPAGRELPKIGPVRPVLKSRRLETQLMLLLGGGFGLGVALTLGRLFADLSAGLTAAGAAGCGLAGLVATMWLVRTRGLLHDRAVLDRWVSELMAGARCTAEELVALRVLSAEAALVAALADRNEADHSRVAIQTAALDGELHRHATADARAEKLRAEQLRMLHRALAAVRGEWDRSG